MKEKESQQANAWSEFKIGFSEGFIWLFRFISRILLRKNNYFK
jgi:hypothetical protein